MIIAVDGMGGDFAPSAVVEGVVGAVKEENIDVIITGKEQKIREELSKYSYPEGKISILEDMVPSTTFDYLISDDAKPIIDKIIG